MSVRSGDNKLTVDPHLQHCRGVYPYLVSTDGDKCAMVNFGGNQLKVGFCRKYKQEAHVFTSDKRRANVFLWRRSDDVPVQNIVQANKSNVPSHIAVKQFQNGGSRHLGFTSSIYFVTQTVLDRLVAVYVHVKFHNRTSNGGWIIDFGQKFKTALIAMLTYYLIILDHPRSFIYDTSDNNEPLTKVATSCGRIWGEFGTTSARGKSPSTSSLTPITAASSTSGCRRSTDSSSTGDTFIIITSHHRHHP